jgi:ubiquinone/menaquinone biosynthesis C-methylase UbiE
MSIERPADYVPAAGRDWLLPVYDPISRFLVRDHALKGRLIREAALAPGERVLDLGCGTGTLLLLAARAHPDVTLTGVDGDDKALAIARRKLARAGAEVRLDTGLADRLPYPDASFDHVFSTAMFHHLSPDERAGALREVRRVLRPGGAFHLVDFGPTTGFLSRLTGHLFHAVSERAREVFEGRLPERMREAGFAEVGEHGRHATPFGTFYTWRGRKPPA